MGGDRGFSLIAVLVAMSILAVALVAVAELFGTAASSNIRSRDVTAATILAQQKVVELRPAPAGEGVDDIDQFGRPVTGDGEPPPGAIYTRRWIVEASPGTVTGLVIDVRVSRATSANAAGRAPDGARLVTFKAGPL